jgi:predicted nucleic acid-binding protein
MRRNVIVDTGPIVASLNLRDADHDWTVQQLQEIEPPLLTCEAVLSEACFLLRNTPNGKHRLLEMVERGVISLPFHLDAEIAPITAYLRKYADVPISLADACLVRMAELWNGSPILTFDGDFLIYRKNSNPVIETIMP